MSPRPKIYIICKPFLGLVLCTQVFLEGSSLILESTRGCALGVFNDVIPREATGTKVQHVFCIGFLLVDMMEKMLCSGPIAFHGFSITFPFSLRINNPLHRACRSVLKPSLRYFN